MNLQNHSSRGAAILLMTSSLLLSWVGCATHEKRVAGLRAAFTDGDLHDASSQSEKLLAARNKKNATLLKLDQSLIRLAEGKPDQTEQLLLDVRNQFDSVSPLANLQNVSSLILDDQSRAFRPDDYEQLFVLMFLAMTNLVQDGDDAYAYATQVNQLQSEIESNINRTRAHFQESQPNQPAQTSQLASHNLNSGPQSAVPGANQLPPVRFKQIALAPFIAGILHEQTHRDYDAAERYFAKAAKFNPNCRTAADAVMRAKHGRHSQKGNGVLYLFVGVGKGPYKVEQAEVPTSQALLIADRILSQVGDHTLPPTLAPIKTSRVVVPPNDVQAIRVMANGQVLGETETIANLGQIAIEQNEAKHPAEMARAIVRRIVKKSAIYAGKDALNTPGNSWVDLLINAGGVLWEAAESADTRCWGLLPEKIQVLRIEMPAGRHQIKLMPLGAASPQPSTVQVELRDGFNTYLYATFPTGKMTGEALVSSQPH